MMLSMSSLQGGMVLYTSSRIVRISLVFFAGIWAGEAMARGSKDAVQPVKQGCACECPDDLVQQGRSIAAFLHSKQPQKHIKSNPQTQVLLPGLR